MINHFRVDSKLIHGQITTRLPAFKHCNRILLIDDTVAGDESMRNIFSTVIPHSVKIHFRGMGDALNALERAQASANRYLVIVRTPETALALLRQGYAFGCTLTCGQLTNDRGNGIPVLKGVNLLPEDIAAAPLPREMKIVRMREKSRFPLRTNVIGAVLNRNDMKIHCIQL